MQSTPPSDGQSGSVAGTPIPTSYDDSHVTKWSLNAIAQISTVIAGLVYATGFLVVFNYLDTLGIHDAPGDFFKLKYMHVGILCLVPLVLGIGLLFAILMLYGVWKARRQKSRRHFARFRKSRRKTLSGTTPSYMGVFLLGNLLVVFYLLIMFTTFGFIRERYAYFIALCALTLGGLFVGSEVLPKIAYYIPTYCLTVLVRAYALALKLDKTTIPMHMRKTIVTRAAQWIVPSFKLVLFVAALLLDFYCFDWNDIASKFSRRTVFYLVLLLCFVYFTGRIYVLQERFASRPRQRALYRVLGICALGLLYYLVVVTFAYSIYPFIPAGRGGADLSESSAITLTCDAGQATALPTSLIGTVNQGRLTSIPLVAIEEDAESILVAPLEEYRTWHEERKSGTGCPKLPRIFRIRFGRSSMFVVAKDTNVRVDNQSP